MFRNLIWTVLLGIALALLTRSLRVNKSTAGNPTVGGIAKVRMSVPNFINATPNLPSNPQTNAVQIIVAPTAAVESASTPDDDPEKVAVLVSSLSEAEVRNWLTKLTDQELAGNTGRLLIRRWVELDPSAAVNWVSQLGDAGARQTLVDAVAVAWSQKDLPTALAWVESLPEDATKYQALTDLSYEVARVDPVNALQIATQLPAGENTDALLLHALSQYASANPGQSQQLALALPPGPLRDQVLTTVATVQAKLDGESAARFAVENIPPGPVLDRAVIGVVQLWGQNDFADAAAWVQSFPASDIRDQAAQSLLMVGAR
jgi:hypothetical protein